MRRHFTGSADILRGIRRGFSDSKCMAKVQGQLESDRDPDDAVAHEDAAVIGGKV